MIEAVDSPPPIWRKRPIYLEAPPLEETPGRKRTPPEDRFWPKVTKTDTCWLWTASTITGYGHFMEAPGRRIMAHRWAYTALVGPIPDGLQLDHLCRIRNCVNPAHLEPVTAKENMRRAKAAVDRP